VGKRGKGAERADYLASLFGFASQFQNDRRLSSHDVLCVQQTYPARLICPENICFSDRLPGPLSQLICA
jgi:hypothetical protein